MMKRFDPDGSGLFYNSSVAHGECLLGGLMNMSQSIDLHPEHLWEIDTDIWTDKLDTNLLHQLKECLQYSSRAM